MENKKQYVSNVFDTIAYDYDRMNLILTAGMFTVWQKSLLKKMNLQKNDQVIDICCGSGEMTIKIKEVLINKGAGEVTGIDFSENMLIIARKKALQKSMKINFEKQDALDLQYPNKMFTHAINSFALRNVENILQSLSEMHRILKDNGKAYVMEVSKPENNLIRFFFEGYYYKMVPLIGRISDKGRKIDSLHTPYEWLSESLKLFPEKKEIISLFYQAGFTNVMTYSFGFGGITLYIAEKKVVSK